MIKKWFTMKKKEIELKLFVYTYAVDFLKNKDEVINMTKDVYAALEGISQEELKDALMAIIAKKSTKRTILKQNKFASGYLRE